MVVSIAASAAERPGTSETLPQTQARIVATLSFFNALGRLVGGSVGDFISAREGSTTLLDRSSVTAFTAVLALVSQLWGMQADTLGRPFFRSLQVPTALTGLAQGFVFGTIPVLTIEYFGLSRFSTNNGFFALAPAFFGWASSSAFGAAYDAATRRYSSLQLRAVCAHGPSCYRPALVYTASLACFALVLAIVLIWRRSRTIRSKLYRREPTQHG